MGTDAEPATGRPNFLILMCDQLQARAVFDSDLCHTPHLDRLRERGLSFVRAYTPNAVCSPARASLMTGKLPHNHNVLWVTHTMSPDQVRIREGLPHFAEDLVAAGYTTSYVGKWHVEPAEKPSWYGWQRDRSSHSQVMARQHVKPAGELIPRLEIAGPEGFRPALLAGVTQIPVEERRVGAIVAVARRELRELTGAPPAPSRGAPWCLFVSTPEPHDPYVAGLEAYRQYDRWNIDVPQNWLDDLEGRPRIYQRAARAFSAMTESDRLEAARCYYASITEIDAQFGLLLQDLEERGVARDTVVVLLTDHGDFLGAHGMYCKNLGGWEEAYNVPVVVAGPGIAGATGPGGPAGITSLARVGTHALFPSLMSYYRIPSKISCDAPLFDDVLAASVSGDRSTMAEVDAAHATGLAEYHGGRLLLTQRIYYRDRWKLVWNGFDDHEFYDLARDPWELENLAGRDGPAVTAGSHQGDDEVATAYRRLTAEMWREIRRTGDRSLAESQYIGLRATELGPEIE